MTTITDNNNNNNDNNEGGTVVAMVPCRDCGHLVPEGNLAIHQATACGARARARPASDDHENERSSSPIATNLGPRQRRSWSTPTRREAPTVQWSTPTVTEQASSGAAATGAASEAAQRGTGNPKIAIDHDAIEVIENSPGVSQVGDMVDLTAASSDTPVRNTTTASEASSSSSNNSSSEQEWPCPQCTLLNPKTQRTCGACHYQNPNIVRQADRVRHERLVNDFGSPPMIVRGNSAVPSTATSGAILGSMLGAANAYMGGRHVGGGALEGAMTGLIGGAIVGEVLRDRNTNPPTPTTTSTTTRATTQSPSISVASARSGASMGHPTYPSMNGSGVSSSRRLQPRRSVRVVRRGNGMTTIYTSSGGGGMHVAGVGGTDPMFQLMMQSLLAGGGGGQGTVDGMSYEQLLQAFGDGTEHLGAEEGAIQSLPTATVRDPSTELPQDQRQCCICLQDFEKDETRKTLPCLHGFHKDCVDKWLRSNGSCPICKHKVD